MRSGMTLHGLFFKLEKKITAETEITFLRIMIKDFKYNFYTCDIKM